MYNDRIYDCDVQGYDAMLYEDAPGYGHGQKFVDLMSDAGFKAVYADRENKPLLISLLNMVLPDGVRVHDIKEYRDREQTPDTIFSKKTVLDLICSDFEGNIFSVEVQQMVDSDLFKRCVYYGSGHYHAQLGKGEDYYRLHPVYVIAFLGEKLPQKDESIWDTERFISYYQFIEKRSGEVADDTILIIFAEVARFTKSWEECVTERDKVFYWFKRGWAENVTPESPEAECGDGTFPSLVRATEIAAFTPQKKAIYEMSYNTERDIRYAQRVRYNQGIAKGREEGLEEGRAEGLEKGAHAKAIEVARNLKTIGMSVRQISQVTELSEEEVAGL